MTFPRWFPSSLTRRFALASAALVAAALLVTSLTSWWLIDRQHDHALEKLASRERQFRATVVGSDLHELAHRMTEIAGSTLLATGLVDSAGRETYLGPFLAGIRQINGIPVQVMFTDFQGTEIASNAGARFTREQVNWLRQHLEAGQRRAAIFPSASGAEMVALEPMLYERTSSPEGAVLYKIAVKDIKMGPAMSLEWGPPALPAGQPARDDGQATPVPVPEVFRPLQFRVRGGQWGSNGHGKLDVPYAHVLLISLTLFAAVVVAGMQLARLLTRDLQRLDAFSSRLFGSGLGSDRAPEGDSEEVASLSRSINGMLDRLNEQHGALLQEREKLTRLTEALKSADRNKDDFLAMLGHELRNPLAPISAGAELLRRIARDDPRLLRTSELIARQVDHMTKIVNDLLDVSRVTRGLITLNKTAVSIADVVDAAVEQARPLMTSARHELTVSLPPEPLIVLADSTRLVQVLSNLLANAAKYTPPGGHIDLTVTATAEEVCMAVRDNGLGIAPDLMPSIFELFTQGTRTMDRQEGGLGLGLALVKHLMTLHGGTVEASSAGTGQGAMFRACLPRVPAPLALSADPVPSGPAITQRLRVMVVDDNVDAAQSLGQLLMLEGHAVQLAHDGPAALALMEQTHEPTDVFILDIGLPGMDGTELARHLRALPATRHALFIALTGYGQSADRDKSAQARFDHHLVKPADFTALQALLAAHAGARAAAVG